MILSYYRDSSIPNGDSKNTDVPLQLNCTGRNSFSHACFQSSIRQDYYLFFLWEGEYQVQAPIQGTLKAGSLIIYDAEKPFSYSSQGNVTHFFAHFTGSCVPQLLRQCNLRVNTIYTIPNSEQLPLKFQSLFQAFLFRDEMFDLDLAQKLTSLLVAIGRSITTEHANPPARRRLEKSLQYIHEHFTKDISVETLAELEYLSVSRYRELFTSSMKQSPYNYIIKLRMNTACELLGTTQLSILQVAQAVGYSDQRYFARLFQKNFGMTPSAYRATENGILMV